jgi:hypothetical protein
MAVCQEWDKHTKDIKARFHFSKAYIWENHVSHDELN